LEETWAQRTQANPESGPKVAGQRDKKTEKGGLLNEFPEMAAALKARGRQIYVFLLRGGDFTLGEQASACGAAAKIDCEAPLLYRL
jgi:hypothetical protein